MGYSVTNEDVRERQRLQQRKVKLRLRYAGELDTEIAKTLERFRLLIEIQSDARTKDLAERRGGRRNGVRRTAEDLDDWGRERQYTKKD